MLTHSQQLRKKIDLVRSDLKRSAAAFWRHPYVAELVPEFLLTVHSVTRATVPSMEETLRCARSLAATDAVAAGMVDYLAHHIPQEIGHDEWTLEDLAVLGFDRSALLQRMPSSAVAALAGSQYYWVRHHHPVAYMGYIAVLEYPADALFLEEVIAKTGLPREAFRTYLMHAQLDPHHVREFDETLDSLPLTSDHSSIVGISAFTTCHLLGRIYDEVTASYEEGKYLGAPRRSAVSA
jgi:hypothetical protein